MSSLPEREPVLTAATAIVTAGVSLLAALGVEVDAQVAEALVPFIVAVYGVALLVRSQVTPTKKSNG